MKRKENLPITMMVIVAVLVIVVMVLSIVAARAQEKEKKPTPCTNQVKAFVLEATKSEGKIKELGEQGYCVAKQNFLSLIGGKVLLVVDTNDMLDEDEECESGEECE
jgi:hypothetical protein